MADQRLGPSARTAALSSSSSSGVHGSEATRKELRELLSAFGELTSIRLPKKFDGKHRGFAFADFVTHQEAMAAKDALQATHLYGRHLVI